MGSLIRNSTGTRGKATYRGKDLTGARSPQRKLIPDMSGRTRMSQPDSRGTANRWRPVTVLACAEASATEEPDVGILHVRVCAGGAG
jgi:hypothetical protein